LVVEDMVAIVVQVNGKTRAVIEASLEEASRKDFEAKALELALKEDKVGKWVEGKEIRRVIYVPAKTGVQGLLSIVV